ncbi:hypothetical protein B9Z55_001485 [Caenorhabditis nigoni]|uniref:Spindle assembly abnormal protein 4 n=1 Tax=Caenorhabditis nigoni TaxID=1611254 RepID=A0A2G5VFZ3_9PELO|nr:hypothetical protein B9Z55_001485 [Caenorhabditis nigoni]
MLPSENGDEDQGSQKPKRAYLRKGEGTARFRMTRRSAPLTSSPAINLPRFTPTNSAPSSARTIDSGIPHDDDTRPPTTASLPLDQPSVSEGHNSGNLSGNDEHREEDHVEVVSAMPSYVPGDRSSSVLETCSKVSEEATQLRAEADRITAQANFINSMKSVSITPSSYSSNISGPIYQSTPKGSLRHDDLSDDPTFLPPPLVPPRNHSPQTLSSLASSGSLDTPQARPLASNRLNMMVQNEAQTGISLLNNPRRQPMLPAHHHPSQKENVPERKAPSEHVYDEPLQIQRPHRANRDEQRQKHNLMLQLRDTIAHLDYASECVWSTRKKQEEAYAKRMKELEEDFKSKMQMIQEDNRSEEERLKRERRDIERDRKILQKGIGAREKEHTQMIAKLREKLSNSESQNAKLRQDKRAVEEKMKKFVEENEKLTKDLNRNRATCQRLEKHIKQLRTEKEKDDKEKEMFAKVAMNRKVAASGIATGSAASSRLPSVSSLASSMKTGSTGKGRTVSFADDEPEEQTLEAGEETMQPEFIMRPYETKQSRFGTSTMYRDSIGETTRVTNTIANGLLFEYSNGDFRWMNRQNSVEIYRIAVDKSIIVNLLQYNISFIYSFQRQLEVWRPGNNTTLISVKRREVRTELHCDNGTYYTEIFDRNGRYVTKDFCHPEVFKDIPPGSACSYRDGGTRYVEYTTPEDFELVEPEYRLRWYQGKVMVCKIIKRPRCNEKTLRVQVDVTTGSGILEEVESQLKDGQSQKTTVFPWS